MVPFFIDIRFSQILWDYYWLFFVIEDTVHISVDQVLIPGPLWGSWKKENMCRQVRWGGSISLRVGFPRGTYSTSQTPKPRGVMSSAAAFSLWVLATALQQVPWGARPSSRPQVSPGPFTCGYWNCSHFFLRPHIAGDRFSSDLIPLSVESLLISSI